MAQAKVGDTVKVRYTGSLENGTVFDGSHEQEPLEVTIGKQNMLPSFEEEVVGMSEGDKKTFSIQPDDAFGQRQENLVFDIERSKLPSEIDLQIGRVLRVESDAGRNYDVTVIDIDDEKVTFDGNHPLAGKVLNFDIELVEIV